MRDANALAEYLRQRNPLTSVVSYPQRGPWGNNRYPGNCSGYMLIDLCATYRSRKVLDPMEGGGTSREVCADMGITYAGFDLHSGTDSLRDEIGSEYDLIFWHPPYHDMKTYSEDTRDLSRAGSLAMFQQQLRIGYQRFFECLSPGGRLVILMGDLRRRGVYEPLTIDVARLDRAHIEGIIIKIQHNTSSGKTNYTGSFVPILHETLTVFRRSE